MYPNKKNKIILNLSVILVFFSIIISQGSVKNVIDPTEPINDKGFIQSLINLSNLIPNNETIVTSDNSPYVVYFTKHYSTAPWVVEYEESAFNISMTTIAVTGGLNITSNPQGARIFIDGKPQDPYVTPMVFTNITPGNHIIKLSLKGYKDYIKSIDIVPGQKISTNEPKIVPKEILINYMKENNYSYLIVFEGQSQIKIFDELFDNEGLKELDNDFIEIINYSTEFSKIHLYRMKK